MEDSIKAFYKLLFKIGFQIKPFKDDTKLFVNDETETFVRRARLIFKNDSDKLLPAFIKFLEKKKICMKKPVPQKDVFLVTIHLKRKLGFKHKILGKKYIFRIRYFIVKSILEDTQT